MKKLLLKFKDGMPLVINLKEDAAPETIKMLTETFPEEIKLLHARFAGEAFFFKPSTDKNVPEENTKLASEMETGEVSMYLGDSPAVKNAVHFWYGPKRKTGGKAENVFGTVDGDVRRLKEFALKLWSDGPVYATAVIIEE